MMKYLTTAVLTLSLAVLAGCSGMSSDGNANAGPAVAEPTPMLAAAEYSDPNLALADGIKLTDIGDTERAIELFNRAIELNPDLAEAYFRLGIAWSLIEFRDEQAALGSVEATPEPTASPKRGKEPDAPKPNSAIAFEKAVKAYQKIIDASPDDHNAHYNLGRALSKLNEDEDAAKALKQAVKLQPDDAEYQTELGAILIKLAKYSEAVAALKKAVSLDPQNLEAEELLEKAGAGEKRVAFTKLPENRAAGNTNSSTAANSSSNTTPPPPGEGDKPPATPRPIPPAPTPAPRKSP